MKQEIYSILNTLKTVKLTPSQEEYFLEELRKELNNQYELSALEKRLLQKVTKIDMEDRGDDSGKYENTTHYKFK